MVSELIINEINFGKLNNNCFYISNFYHMEFFKMSFGILFYFIFLAIRKYIFSRKKAYLMINIPEFFIFKAERIDLFIWFADIGKTYIFLNVINITLLNILG